MFHQTLKNSMKQNYRSLHLKNLFINSVLISYVESHICLYAQLICIKGIYSVFIFGIIKWIKKKRTKAYIQPKKRSIYSGAAIHWHLISCGMSRMFIFLSLFISKILSIQGSQHSTQISCSLAIIFPSTWMENTEQTTIYLKHTKLICLT